MFYFIVDTARGVLTFNAAISFACSVSVDSSSFYLFVSSSTPARLSKFDRALNVYSRVYYSVMTVQPYGMPLLPLIFQVASLLLTNVPLLSTSKNQLLVVYLEGSSVNKALT